MPPSLTKGSNFGNTLAIISLEELAIRRRRIAAAAAAQATSNEIDADSAALLIAQSDRLSIGMENKAKVRVNIYSQAWYRNFVIQSYVATFFEIAAWLSAIIVCFTGFDVNVFAFSVGLAGLTFPIFTGCAKCYN